MKQVSLKKNALLNIIYKLSSMIFPLIIYPYVSRVLAPAYMGKVSFFTTVSNYAMMIGSLGITMYGIRATAKVREDKKELSKVTEELLIINSVVTIFVVAALLLSALFVEKFNANFPLLVITSIQVALAPLNVEWLYNGLEKYDYITKRAIAFKTLTIVLIFLFVKKKEDYIIYAAILALSFIGNYIVNIVYSRHFVDYGSRYDLDVKRHIKPVLILFAAAIAINIYTSVDTLMLGFINGDRAVGLYDIAVKAKTVLLSLINAVSAVIFPRLSFYVSTNDKKAYDLTLRKSIALLMDISIPMAMFFLVESQSVVLLLGGKNYIDSTLAMQILMPILVFSGFSNITGNQILLPHNKDIDYLVAVLIGALTDVVLNAMLMPRYSLYGAAAATFIAEFVEMMVQIVQSKQYLKNNIDYAEMIKTIICTAVATTGIVFVDHYLQFSAIIKLILSFTIYIAVYLICSVILKLDILHQAYEMIRKAK